MAQEIFFGVEFQVSAEVLLKPNMGDLGGYARKHGQTTITNWVPVLEKALSEEVGRTPGPTEPKKWTIESSTNAGFKAQAAGGFRK